MQQISVEALKARIDAGEKINLIDCREPEEFAEFNIGGQLIPLGKFQRMDVDELAHLKEEEIIIHCRSGKRSAMACMLLDTMGFTQTVNVTGGVLEWIEKFGK